MFEDFTKFLPSKWFDNVFVMSTSNSLQLAGEQPTSLAEMYCYVGLKLLIATVVRFSQCQFFSNKEYDEIHNLCPFKLNEYMVTQQMELLDQHISFTDKDAPAFIDKFWEIWQMLEAWHSNMPSFFIFSWIVCLDESMSIWKSRFTCPDGFSVIASLISLAICTTLFVVANQALVLSLR